MIQSTNNPTYLRTFWKPDTLFIVLCYPANKFLIKMELEIAIVWIELIEIYPTV